MSLKKEYTLKSGCVIEDLRALGMGIHINHESLNLRYFSLYYNTTHQYFILITKGVWVHNKTDLQQYSAEFEKVSTAYEEAMDWLSKHKQ